MLDEGDIISIDCGAIIEGWTPTPRSRWAWRDRRRVRRGCSKITRRLLEAAIDEAVDGHRVEDIGAAVEDVVEPRVPLVREYVGHGIGPVLHVEPEEIKYGPTGRGMTLKSGTPSRSSRW